ncbi:N-Dimethylarginine dimethylaminohydrolase [Microbulbifer donghaiensis]|uniref:arginine deiminase n=1 Tax=Microbulbifer donghaiensis TaxID=494016 RepID=A0A1M4X1B2_9GAMM|nr:arginine deiminase family protein [Microbulbifer donghaiensis]SHE87113.1 N-Dimethylarginine dimethylaminohydrolase [Microbulbifer donghaiensis]
MANDVFSMRSRREGGTPKLNYWGADSETGTLRDVLVGPVDNLTRILPTNSMNRKLINAGIQLDVPLARAQYQGVLDCFEDAGVKVHITPADPDLPLQLWARDGSFMTPWGMLIGRMAQWWRTGEYGPVMDFCYQNDLPIFDKVTAGYYEGGDFMMIKPGYLLLGYSNERSQAQGAEQIKRWFEAEGWQVCLYEFDPYFVHADCTIAMLNDSTVALCRDVVNREVQDWFRELNIEIVDVPFGYIGQLGINVVSLGQDRVLLPKQSNFLADRCRGLGFKVYDPDVSAITMVGGGIHCMCQPLRRDSLEANSNG